MSEILFKNIDEPGLQKIETYERLGGYQALTKALKMSPDEVTKEIDTSGVRGRGGAGFPMGKKVSFLPRGDIQRYLCCNCDESEPGTFKDRELVHKNPHQLIEGIIISSYAASISKAFIYIRGEYEEEAVILEQAIEEATRAGLIGDNILDSGFSLSLVVHRGAGAYICGEETALLDSLEGKRGNPRLKPPFPANEGLFKGPTLINNVETLSNVSHIVTNGGAWYASIGTERSTGTKLVSVSGCIQRPGNYEIELGIPARKIIEEMAGGPPEGRSIKAWFPGGSSSPILKAEDLDIPYDFESIAEAGSMLGSGSIIVVDDSIPIVSVLLRLAQFYHHESCGKCSPCREGTNWTVRILERVERGDASPSDLDVVASIQDNISGHSLCPLGDAMAMPVSAIVKKFRDEIEQHIETARQTKREAVAV